MKPQSFVLEVRPTGGVPCRAGLAPDKKVPFEGFEAELTCSGDVWGVVLYAQKPVRLAGLELQAVLPAQVWNDELLFYSNVSYTNDIAEVLPWASHRDAVTRDMLVLHSSGEGDWGFAQVTAHRFYAELAFGEQCVVQRTDMEDKALVPGQEYRLERFVMGLPGEDAEAFLARTADRIAGLNGAVPLQQVPQGWCSWSCFYSQVSAEKLAAAARETAGVLAGRGANLVQIDDGWQAGGSFPGRYVPDETKFPGGLSATAACVHENGMRFGLWLAPLLLCEGTPFYQELSAFARTDETTLCPGVPAHPFDYDSPAFYAHLHDLFADLTKQLGVEYYKLDFLAAGFHHFTGREGNIRCKNDYIIALVRKALKTIREAVGDEVVLVSCGAPLLESAGIFNAARVSCDIIWGKGPELPTYWQIMQRVTRTVLYRHFYHRVVFMNDPDGLVVRDCEVGDGFDCTWSEARLWATTVALSGGSVLVNEELDRLSPRRRELFSQLTPALGIAARPTSFFEQPVPTHAVLRVDDGTCFAASYHWGDVLDSSAFSVSEYGFAQALAVRCWDKKPLGVLDAVQEKNRQPHSAELYLLRAVPRQPCFYYADVNVFCGVGLYTARVENGAWKVETDGRAAGLPARLYGWVPDGCTAPGEVTERLPGGSVVLIPQN